MAGLKKMENLAKLQAKRPELVKTLLECSRDELLELFALEVAEKEELEEYKENNVFFETDLEHIVNLGVKWLKKNKKNNHHLYIKDGQSKLIYTNIEQTFI